MNIRTELQNSQLCEGLTEAQLNELMNKITVKEKHYKNNEILFYTDEVTKVYILVKGNAAIAKNTSSGKRILGKKCHRTWRTGWGDLLFLASQSILGLCNRA